MKDDLLDEITTPDIPTIEDVKGIETLSDFMKLLHRILYGGCFYDELPVKYELIEKLLEKGNSIAEVHAENASIRKVLKMTCRIRNLYDETGATEYEHALLIIQAVMTGEE